MLHVQKLLIEKQANSLSSTEKDIRYQAKCMQHMRARTTGVENHFHRTPIKFQTLFEQVQKLHAMIDSRHKREVVQFPEYNKSIEPLPTSGPTSNGPEHRYRGFSLGDYLADLRK
jgi:hypothetical protein